VPKQLYKLNDFSGGLNTVKDGADIADNEVQTAQNVMFNVYGGIQPSYSLAQTGNKISAYQADEVAEVEPGYGLGYFETDHARDATTVSFTGANDNTGGSEDGFFVYQEDGGSRGLSVVNNRLKYLVNGTVQDLGASFSIGDILTITGNTSSVSKSFSDGMLFASAQGVYTVVARANSDKELILDRGMNVRLDSTTAGHFNLSITGHSLGDSLILVANPAAHDIDVFSTDANNYTHNTIALRSSATGIASKVKYYRVEDSIRCCDTADKNDCKIQWYGWIQRRHFEGATSSTDQANSYMGYYANDNTLAPPTEDDLATSTGTAGAVSTYPNIAGTGFEIAIATETDVDGLIEAGTYELASTFIYDGNQESLPFAYTNTHTVSEDDEFKSLSVNIGAKGPYDERISGGRIYIRKQGDDSEYIMLVDIDLTKGARTKLSDDYTAWFDAGTATYNCPTATASENFSVTELGFITYEVINGFSSSIFSNALGDQGEHWKDAVVSNNRVFICNVTMKDEETGNNKSEATVKSFPDRIMYSMPNRYDTFPSDNFIEAAKGDADVYIAIEAYADRLFAYKRYSVDIINIAGDDRNWFLEDSKQYQGVAHPEAVKRTQYGLVWVNEQGLFLYNGSSITNLKEDKIDDATWAAHIASNSSIIYDQQQSMVFVIKNMSNDGDAYMCDLKKGNFTLIKDFILDTNDGITNSVDAETERTYIGHDSGSAVDIYQVKRTLVAATNTKFTTKTLDFGNPAQVKKIYAVHLTYKSDVALTNLFTIVEEDNSSTALAGTISASASNWAKVKITPSSPIVCNKASLKLDTSSTSAKVYINDISIEYRTLYRKGV
jgi:hypothetical protein